MNQRQRELQTHAAQALAAVIIAAGFALAAVVALFTHGPAQAVAFALGAAVFWFGGRPPPSGDLDKHTGR